ncbi:MAG: response regulator transcription factor [Bacteroidetes bacterium]|nr:response regulator transcription factor [Bacteroidota bacterium]
MVQKSKAKHEINILVVEDEEDIAEVIAHFLGDVGYNVDIAYDGQQALNKAHPWTDLILLDVMLPKIDGFEVCQQLRSKVETEKIPIIFLTAKDEDQDQVRGLMLGGDDYLTKPVSMEVLLARIRAGLRRAQIGEVETITIMGLTIYVNEYRAEFQGIDLGLTLTELELLSFLIRHPRQAHRRKELLDVIWPDSKMVTQRTVDTHMKNLREKLGSFARYIETVRGVGYRFNDAISYEGEVNQPDQTKGPNGLAISHS